MIFPHVYPSHKFRTTGFVLKNLKDLIKDKVVCDMGCGPGIVGLYALRNGATQVVQADINPRAIENAKENNIFHGFGEDKIKTYQSDCFDSIPKCKFDIIVFNMPYHCDKIEIDDPLKYAFYDPAFISINKFLSQAREYSHQKTQIFIAFSNKGDTSLLENVFEKNQYNWELWKITNTEQKYDNRIYLLT
jgi:methylase of polypeptide subunit release factors